MDNLKKLANKLKGEGYEFPLSRLQLGIKLEGGGIKPTGRHEIKFLAEPVLEMRPHPHTGVERQVVVFKLLEDRSGKQYKWDFTVFLSKAGKTTPHYLIERLIDVPVKEWLALEMRQKCGKNYVAVEYPLDHNGKIASTEKGDFSSSGEEGDVYPEDSEPDDPEIDLSGSAV